MTNNPNQAGARALVVMLFVGLCLVVPGAVPTSQAQASSSPLFLPTGSVPSAGQVLVLRVYFRSVTERDSLASVFGAVEVATTGGFLTVYADEVTFDALIRRGIRVEVDREQTQQGNPSLKRL